MSRNAQRVLLAIGWLYITGLTVRAIAQDGWGLFTLTFTESATSFLVINDLAVELILISIVLYLDCRRRGKNPWGWIAVTMVLGAVGSLGYLFLRTFDPSAPPLLYRAPAPDAPGKPTPTA